MKRIAPILVSLLLAGGGVSLPAQETNSEAGTDLKSFDMLWRKNIFDQSRTGVRGREGGRRQPRVDRIILRGTSVGDGDPMAFFGGSAAPDSEGHTVGYHLDGFEITRITPDCVKLSNATNSFVVEVEKSLRRVDNGPWEGSADISEPAADTSTNAADGTAASASAPATADAGHPGESAIERKLRLRREQEEK